MRAHIEVEHKEDGISRNPFVIRSLLRMRREIEEIEKRIESQSLRYQVTPSDPCVFRRNLEVEGLRRNPFVIRSLLRIESKKQLAEGLEKSQSLRYQVTPSDKEEADERRK